MWPLCLYNIRFVIINRGIASSFTCFWQRCHIFIFANGGHRILYIHILLFFVAANSLFSSFPIRPGNRLAGVGGRKQLLSRVARQRTATAKQTRTPDVHISDWTERFDGIWKYFLSGLQAMIFVIFLHRAQHRGWFMFMFINMPCVAAHNKIVGMNTC